MSEHKNPARQSQSEQRGRTPDPAAPERLTTAEKSLIRRFTEVLRFADFVALLMVAATAFSAYAAWRTAQVTSHIFALEERPFLGVERITFEQGDTPNPRAVIEYRQLRQNSGERRDHHRGRARGRQARRRLAQRDVFGFGGRALAGGAAFFLFVSSGRHLQTHRCRRIEPDAPCARGIPGAGPGGVLLHRARGFRLSFGGFQTGRWDRSLPSIGYLLTTRDDDLRAARLSGNFQFG